MSVGWWGRHVGNVYVEEGWGQDTPLWDACSIVLFDGWGVIEQGVGLAASEVVCSEFENGRWDGGVCQFTE